jgi:hypothetical protein
MKCAAFKHLDRHIVFISDLFSKYVIIDFLIRKNFLSHMKEISMINFCLQGRRLLYSNSNQSTVVLSLFLMLFTPMSIFGRVNIQRCFSSPSEVFNRIDTVSNHDAITVNATVLRTGGFATIIDKRTTFCPYDQSASNDESALFDSIYISFGQSIPRNFFVYGGLEDAGWNIHSISSNGPAVTGSGLSLFEHLFDQPGTYQISFTRVPLEKSSCKTHGAAVVSCCDPYNLPDQITVLVGAQKIEYRCDEITFSQTLAGGQNTKGIIMYVPVAIADVGGVTTLVQLPESINSYGIRTSITGNLIPEQLFLPPGNHILQYHLSGEGTSDTYMGFDFPDVNGHMMSCGLPFKLN